MFVLAVGLSCWQYFRSLGHSGRMHPREGMDERKTSSAAREREEATDEEVDEVEEEEQQQEASV